MARTDRHLVVDGSNIATEGRTLPSLAQLDEAVRAISAEYSYDSLTVVVDATFAHRIDDSEKEEFEEAVLAGELVTPPAGAIGRGDAFILQVAEKVSGVVFSNDSFQEFHGEHDWLFDQGRLIGGKPIGGVGWVFVERAPVRGPTSRRAIREAEERGGGASPRRRRASTSRSSRAKKPARSSASAKGPAPTPGKSNPPPRSKPAAAPRKKAAAKPAAEKSTESRQGRLEELNDARTFMSFVTQYSIGDDVEGVVEQFSSHGCYLRAASALCYLPSREMGDPPPTRARDVVSQGQTVIVKVESLDSDRRGINVVLVRAVPQDGKGKADTASKTRSKASNRASSKDRRDSGATTNRSENPAKTPQEHGEVADGDRARQGHLTRSTTNVATTKPTARKRAAKSARKKTAAKKTAVKTAAKATTSARVQRATAKKATPKKAVARKAAPKKTAAKKTAAQEDRSQEDRPQEDRSQESCAQEGRSQEGRRPRRPQPRRLHRRRPQPRRPGSEEGRAQEGRSQEGRPEEGCSRRRPRPRRRLPRRQPRRPQPRSAEGHSADNR